MTVNDILPYITGSAGALVVLALVAWGFYIGKVHGDREFNREVQRGDKLELVVTKLEQTVREKDKALEEANARADTAVRATELVASAFTEARRRRSASRAHDGT